MDALENIRARHSVRAFLPREVSRETLRALVDDARRAPSGSNLQPWELAVVTGERLRALRKHLLGLHRESPASYPQFGSRKDPVPGQIWARQKDLGRRLGKAIREAGRDHLSFIVEGSLDFYGAPAAVLFLMDRALSGERLADIGMAAENLLLSASARGLGACPLGMTCLYGAETVLFLGLPGRKRLVMAVAVGYEDPGSPVNAFRSPRAPEDETVTWLE